MCTSLKKVHTGVLVQVPVLVLGSMWGVSASVPDSHPGHGVSLGTWGVVVVVDGVGETLLMFELLFEWKSVFTILLRFWFNLMK